MARDDFNQETKEILAQRVAYRCSNPNCRAPTSGPHSDPLKAVNIGVAAHITAAADGGPRYDPVLTRGVRSAPENGIWLCQNHAKMVDNDAAMFTVSLLLRWKQLAEEAARLEIEMRSPRESVHPTTDLELIRFFSQCFDRPAFQDRFNRAGSMEAFDKAIEDTITAINTGCLRARDGQVLAQAKGKSFLENVAWRRRMDVIVDLLRALRSRYADAVETGEIAVRNERNGNQFYEIRSQELAAWMVHTRDEVLSMFAEVCEQADIPPLSFPRNFRMWRW